MSDQRFCIIPSRALEAENLKGMDLKVLCYFGKHADKHGWWRLSQVKMAKYFKCARSTIQSSVNRLIDAELLEKHPVEAESGRDSAHYWRVIFDHGAPEQGVPEAVVKSRALAEEKSLAGKPDSSPNFDENDPCRYTGTPADISAPPADSEAAPPADPGAAPSITTHLNDPPLSEGESASAREKDLDDKTRIENPERADDPRKFEARVKKLGIDHKGFINQSTQKAVSEFAKLTDAERLEAEERHADFIASCKGRDPLYLSSYFKEKKWTDLPPKRVLTNEEKAVERSMAKPFSVPWMACRMVHLMKGQEVAGIECTSDPIRMIKDKAWPTLSNFDKSISQNFSMRLPECFHDCKEAMEWVGADTQVWQDWIAMFDRSKWPYVPRMREKDGLWFPKGGPEQLSAFAEKMGVEWTS